MFDFGFPLNKLRTIRSMKRFLISLTAVLGAVFLWQTTSSAPAATEFSTRSALASAGSGPVPEASLRTAHWIHLPPGGTPAEAFEEAGIRSADTRSVLKAFGTIMSVQAIQTRDAITLFTDRQGGLVGMELQRFPHRKIVVETKGEGFAARRVFLPTETRVRRIEGKVLSTLYGAIHAVGGDDAVMASFAELFAWDFDFSTETREGDSFAMLLEETWVEGQRLHGGKVLYGEYKPVRSNQLNAYLYEGAQNTLVGYYNAEGESIKKRFLKSPLNFTRISSHFTHSRMHPILKKSRPHLGIDYAAPRGTPVVAIGSGKVIFAGWINGFGKTVKIRHSDGYLTQYAHLSKIQVKKNDHVDQNYIVGNVGSTGHATGPHLDFRVQRNGTWVNPLYIDGGSSPPLPQAQIERYLAYIGDLDQVFTNLGPGESLAWLGTPPAESSIIAE